MNLKDLGETIHNAQTVRTIPLICFLSRSSLGVNNKAEIQFFFSIFCHRITLHFLYFKPQLLEVFVEHVYLLEFSGLPPHSIVFVCIRGTQSHRVGHVAIVDVLAVLFLFYWLSFLLLER